MFACNASLLCTSSRSCRQEISTTAAAEYEPPATDDEKKMVEIWEKVLKVQAGDTVSECAT